MPNNRIAPSEAISKEILGKIQSLSQMGNNNQLYTALVDLSLRKLVQELLEAEVDNFIGAGYYEQGKQRNGYRNGYKNGHIKTKDKKVHIDKPQVCNASEPFKSGLWPNIKEASQERLEEMAIEMYVRGCSTRDVEEILKDKDGNILLSKSGLSRLNKRLWDEYESFCKSDISEYDVVYIFCDAVYESLRFNKSRKEGILVVWGILSSGVKVLLSLTLGNKESYEDWLDAFRGLKKRNLKDAVLGVTDGAGGLIKAFETVFPKTLRQRCLVHKKRNILGKVSSEAVPEVKLHLNSVYYARNKEKAQEEAQLFINKYSEIYPSAVSSFKDDLDACFVYLECPPRHRKHISSTNLAERAFLEEKRRSKVIPRFFTEKSGLQLAFATLLRASTTWSKIRFTLNDHLKILELREKLGQKVESAEKERKTYSRKTRVSRVKQKLFQQK